MNEKQLAVTQESKAEPILPQLSETLLSGQHTPVNPPPASPPPANPAWPVKNLGKYEVTGILGRGGMGLVLKAHDPQIDRDVAIKLLAEQLAADERALSRFQAEAKAAGKLNHPNVVSIYEIGQDGDRHILVLEYVPGGSLNDRLTEGKIYSVLEATKAVLDACKGLIAAHAVGLIHRDIKPANFLWAADGSVKITDFGLAKVAAAEASQQLTQAGLVIGTPFFMSPEQCQAQTVDARSDIYSLGATYYTLLTGQNPYPNSESVPQVMYNHCHGPIPDPRSISPDIPIACTHIIAKAMAKSPDDRYQSVHEMQADLAAVAATLSGQTQIALPSQSGAALASTVTNFEQPALRPGRRLLLAMLALFVICGAGAAAFFAWRSVRGSSQPMPIAGPTGEPIEVGILHSLTGAMANSEMVVVDATMFAIDEINQQGGLLGRPIKAIVADGRSDPETFAREAERLITKEEVCTVFGCWTSASRKTVKPVFEGHDHLLIYPLQYEGCETSPNIVYMGAAPNQQIIPAVEWAVKDLGKKRFFLIGSDYVFPRTANAVIKDYLARLGGEVVGEAYLPLGSLEVHQAVDRIVAAKPDMILNTINGDTNTPFFRALRSAGIKTGETPVLSFSVGEQELRTLSLADIVGDYAAWTYFQSVDTPSNASFVKSFHEKYPQRPVTDAMEAAYDGVKLWAKAAEDAKSVEPKKIRRAMLTQRFQGPGGEVRLDADTQHCFKTPRIGQIEADGQFKIVWEAPHPLPPAPYPPTRSAEDWRAFLHDLYSSWGNRWSAPDESTSPSTPQP